MNNLKRTMVLLTIALLFVCALIPFGYNQDTFLEWLFDGDDYRLVGLLLAWIYVLSWIVTVVLLFLDNFSYSTFASHINIGSMICFALYLLINDSRIRIGLPILLLFSIALSYIGRKMKKA